MPLLLLLQDLNAKVLQQPDLLRYCQNANFPEPKFL